MTELRIFDQEKRNNFIVSLNELIKAIEKTDEKILLGSWIIVKGAYGYGKKICAIEDKLKNSDQYVTESKYLMSLLKSRNEYFNHVCIKKINSDFEFGIFDSAYLYIRSSDYKFINIIKNNFIVTTIDDNFMN